MSGINPTGRFHSRVTGALIVERGASCGGAAVSSFGFDEVIMLGFHLMIPACADLLLGKSTVLFRN